MASQANDSDSMTPSEHSEGEDRSEHDSDYESDDGKDEQYDNRAKILNIMWTGYGNRVPVILFNVRSILYENSNFKTVGGRYKMTFKIVGPDCKIIRNIMGAQGFHEVHPSCPDFNLMWTSCHLKPFTLRTLTEFQKINHFPRSSELTRKDRLYKNIQRMQQIKGAKHFDFVPQTFIMPNEYQEFCGEFMKDRVPWIVKPVAMSRGRGVYLINHPDQVPLDENVIVSRYLQNPLLIDGYKFDVRLYVAVTSYDPLVIYLYEEGLTRFATVKYEKSTKNLRNQCMHLTNYSVNKKSDDYVRNDDPDVEDYGNKWSLGALLRYLRSTGKDTIALMMRIEDVVIKTLLSVELSIATACKMFMPYRGNCFELYGFDILVDDTLKPWVLEVNLSPSLAYDSPLDLKIKGNMLCDLLSLGGLVCHDPTAKSYQQMSRQNMERVRMARAKMNRPQSDTRARGKAGGRGGGSASGAAGDQSMKAFLTGLNSEEIKIMRRVKEEEQRMGGWIRIFPGPNTWDVHGCFLQYNTTHNLMLHQRLYPERHQGLKAIGSACSISAALRSKLGYLQVVRTGKRLETKRAVESYTLATVRAKQYERKLGPRLRQRRRLKDTRGCLVQGMPDDLEDAENRSDEEYEHVEGRGRPSNDLQSSRTSSVTSAASDQRASGHSQQGSRPPRERGVRKKRVVEVNVEVPHPQMPVPVPRSKESASATSASADGAATFNLLQVMNRGVMLTKVQARTAFTVYLQRLKERMLMEGGSDCYVDLNYFNEQMDLVLRFLNRAASNLQQRFRVVVPNCKLPLPDRVHIMTKQLSDFIHIYTKETEQLRQQLKQAEKSDSQNQNSDNGVDEVKFSRYINKASECELEQVLSIYARLKKSSSVFLGSCSLNPSPPQTQQSEMQQQQQQQRQPYENGSDGDQGGPSALPDGSVDSHGSVSAGSLLSRPRSECSLASTSAAVVISHRTTRPQSATSLTQTQAVKLSNRPSSAKPFPLSMSDPVVELYNEEAIQDALHRMSQRQQERQYSSGNSRMVLKSNSLTTQASSSSRENHHHQPHHRHRHHHHHHHNRGTLSPLDEQGAQFCTTHPGTLSLRPRVSSLSWQKGGGKGRGGGGGSGGGCEGECGGCGALISISNNQSEKEWEEVGEEEGEEKEEVYTCSYVFPQQSDSRLQCEDNAQHSSQCPAERQPRRRARPGPVRKNRMSLRTKPPLPVREDVTLMDLYGEQLSKIVFGKQGGAGIERDEGLPGRRSRLSEIDTRHQASMDTRMEASKAKHHAMVAQAHAAQRSNSSSTLGRHGLREVGRPEPGVSVGDIEASIARGVPTFPLNPPLPASHASASLQSFFERNRDSSRDPLYPW